MSQHNVHVHPTENDGEPQIGVAFDGLWCPDCLTSPDEGETITLYECGNCGEITEERRCENCHRFKARYDEPGCPDCNQPLATESLVIDYDGETILAADFEEGGVALAEREAKESAELNSRREAERAAKTAARLNNSTLTTWRQVSIGDVIVPDPAEQAGQPSWATGKLTVVRYLRPTQTEKGILIVAGVHEFSDRIEVHPASEPVLISTIPGQGQKVLDDLGPFGGLTRMPDGDLDVVSSPTECVKIQFGYATRDGGLLPTLMLSTTGKHGGGYTVPFATFIDPDQARSGLEILAKAARDYAEILGVALDPESAVEDVIVDEEHRIHSEPASATEIQVGTSTWLPDAGPLLRLRTAHMNSALDAPHALALAAERALAYVPRLTGIPKA
jgi:predicted RNA-binding Zn-ribbon protein involved in translation (DUF1610 family)